MASRVNTLKNWLAPRCPGKLLGDGEWRGAKEKLTVASYQAAAEEQLPRHQSLSVLSSGNRQSFCKRNIKGTVRTGKEGTNLCITQKSLNELWVRCCWVFSRLVSSDVSSVFSLMSSAAWRLPSCWSVVLFPTSKGCQWQWPGSGKRIWGFLCPTVPMMAMITPIKVSQYDVFMVVSDGIAFSFEFYVLKSYIIKIIN